MPEKVVSPSDALPYPEFAKVVGKTPAAVRGMIAKGKLPVIEMINPDTRACSAGGKFGRAEYWVYLPAWNEGMKLAYESRPKEIRDAWLMWLGLGEPK